MSEYDEQAKKFLEETGTTFKAKFIKNDLYFPDDKEPRDIYRIMLICRGKKYSFRFGQSLQNSGKNKKVESDGKDFSGKPQRVYDVENKNFEEPTPYCVLASLTKSDPSTFEDFCGDFGYDSDSRKAEKIYGNVVKEWVKVSELWTEEEINKLQEIQ